ncbi:hypothetical protein DFJ74DRAFT_126507 [Hyaloraphidium curvatum]|nr:hypothetical protein DFJ74DRAFT_126507 [Hyaloraphidium curvatum]
MSRGGYRDRGGKPGGDDWSCPGCGRELAYDASAVSCPALTRVREQDSNFQRRNQCQKCSEPKPAGPGIKAGELGRDASHFGRQFSEKDWRCSGCGNVNYARRERCEAPEHDSGLCRPRCRCNVCSNPGPKLQAQIGSREGFGGGFRDREDVVEYKRDRRQSDDEWDEFGRRKKKPSDSRKARDDNGGGAPDRAQQAKGDDTGGKEDDDDDGDDGRYSAWKDLLDEEDGGGKDTSPKKPDSDKPHTSESRRSRSPERTRGNDSQRRSSRDDHSGRRSPDRRRPRSRERSRDRRRDSRDRDGFRGGRPLSRDRSRDYDRRADERRRSPYRRRSRSRSRSPGHRR